MSEPFTARTGRAEALLRSGYDPEQENGRPRRSDAWCRALGWQDEIAEEAMTNPRMECEVWKFAVSGGFWTYDTSIKLVFVEHSSAHPDAVAITSHDGTELAVVPLHALYRAVKWLHDGQPKP